MSAIPIVSPSSTASVFPKKQNYLRNLVIKMKWLLFCPLSNIFASDVIGNSMHKHKATANKFATTNKPIVFMNYKQKNNIRSS